MTKRGKGSNCFDNDELMSVYEEYENCGECGMSGADCFDHVEPRAGKYTDSIVNATPMHNQKCNIAKHGSIHTPENKIRLIKGNLKRLFKEKYKFKQNDLDFIHHYESAKKALMNIQKEL